MKIVPLLSLSITSLVLFLTPQLPFARADEEGSETDDDDDEDDEDACRLWLAPSSLTTPNTVQYGLFAGVDFDKDDVIPDIELAIPYVDFFLEGHKSTDYTANILSYLEGHMWASDYSGTGKFEGQVATSPYIPGIGTIGNYHSLISNTKWLMASSLLRERDDITEPGKPHLSRGAITNIYNMTMVATQRIPTGMEIFPNFGDLWDKEEASVFQDRITRKDIEEADKVLDRIVDFYDRFESEMETEELKEDILDFMLDKILGTAAGNRAAVIRSLIPQNHRKLRNVKEAGGVFLYRFRNSIRKPKWLEENGVCVDTMYPGKSTIPAAGRGAFASKDFSAGDLITLIPTVLLGAKDLMTMYDVRAMVAEENIQEGEKADTTTGATYDYDFNRPKGQQIGINYAFGHPESTFLFLPTSPMVHFINHHSSPNARLQWSTHDVMGFDRATWDHSVEEVMNFKSNMVVFEIEALTDIEQGDEIFIHYGPEWEQAWEQYEHAWNEKYNKKKSATSWPLRAEDVKLTFQTKPYPVQSSTSNLLPPGVSTACYLECSAVPDGQPPLTDDGTSIQQWIGPIHYENYTGSMLAMCDLVDRYFVETRADSKNGLIDGGSYNYTVRANLNVEGQLGWYQIQQVPHAAITVVDAPYAGDLHIPDAFRHFIGIPNEIFPQKWRNLR